MLTVKGEPPHKVSQPYLENRKFGEFLGTVPSNHILEKVLLTTKILQQVLGIPGY